MPRTSPDRLRNSGRWTEARFHSFIKSALRAAVQRWGPRHDVKKAAWRERGKYLCAGYKRKGHIVPVSILAGSKRINNIFCDHIEPVIDPKVGFVSWDNVVERMFVEERGLQILCRDCHSAKTKEERKARK